MKLDLDRLDALLALLERRDVTRFEWEDEGVRLALERGSSARAFSGDSPAGAARDTSGARATPPGEVWVTSPFVGTFHRAPGADETPFVEVGSVVTPGQTLCIVEAMKLKNEIESDSAGTVVEVLVADREPVEYGQRLFRIARA